MVGVASVLARMILLLRPGFGTNSAQYAVTLPQHFAFLFSLVEFVCGTLKPMAETNAETAKRWRETALVTLNTAKQLRDQADARSCVSRAYYAVFQLATSVCIAHGDATQFPPGWNNPSHEQLPDLIFKNGNYSLSNRRTVRRLLRELRTLREDADYRIGQTVNAQSVRTALQMARAVFERLENPHDF